MNLRKILILVWCALAAAIAPAWGQSTVQGIPITISADSMTYDPDHHKVLFAGAVELAREDLTVWCEALTLNLKTPDGQQAAAGPPDQPDLSPGELQNIVAERDVRFTINTASGKAAKITYDLDRGILILEGNPSLRDGENSITGQIIRYHLAENRSEVEGGQGQRVQAVFGSAPLQIP